MTEPITSGLLRETAAGERPLMSEAALARQNPAVWVPCVIHEGRATSATCLSVNGLTSSLWLLVVPSSASEIAPLLEITKRTVDAHILTVKQKLRAKKPGVAIGKGAYRWTAMLRERSSQLNVAADGKLSSTSNSPISVGIRLIADVYPPPAVPGNAVVVVGIGTVKAVAQSEPCRDWNSPAPTSAPSPV